MASKLKKGMNVFIMTGKDKTKNGKILFVDHNAETVIIEGCNLVKRATRPSQTNPNGGFVEREAPIHMSNVLVSDPETGKPSRIGFAEVGGTKARIAKKSGKVIDVEDGAEA